MDKSQPDNPDTSNPAAAQVTVHIDGEPVKLRQGDNLLEAMLSEKYNLPYFCWHPAMGSIGACRQCAVTQFADQEQQKGKTIMACMTPVSDGMYIGLNHQPAAEFREQVIAAMMTNHPHDCPVCGEGGACHLQDMTVMTGHSMRRYQGQKRTFSNQYLGPLINHEMNRCITCYRCERFYKDYAGGNDFSACGSKNQVYFGRQQDGILESEFSGNLVEVCPTGVFTDKPFSAHYTRKWDLQSAPSVCQGCAVGCNISVGERYGSVRRVVNRYHHDINGYFICDKGRFGFSYVNNDSRIETARGIELSSEFKPHQLAIALARYKSADNFGIGSERASFESNAALKHMVGSENFCSGLTDYQHFCLDIIRSVMSAKQPPSVNEIEQSDCIIVIDEDLTQSAARIALAVRQATRNAAFDKAEQLGIPRWQDAAVRTAGQACRSNLFLLQSKSSKLDDVATYAEPLHPAAIIKLLQGLGNANQPDSISDMPFDNGLASLLQEIKTALQHAKRPLFIAGCSAWQLETLQAVEQLALQAPPHWQFAFLPDAVNTMGLASLIDQHTMSLEQLIAKSLQQSTVIVLEHSLSTLTRAQQYQLAEQSQTLIVIDHNQSLLSELADVVLPSAPFTESDGSSVNYMGLVQPFFAVKPPNSPIHPAWHWCLLLDSTFGRQNLANITTLSQLRAYLAEHDSSFPDMSRLLAEQLLFKSARQPMRYSGRTAMFANQTVHEPKSPQDTESPFSFSMEGAGRTDVQGQALPKAFSWAPGWNSEQSVYKYQTRIGGRMNHRAEAITVARGADKNLAWQQRKSDTANPGVLSFNGLLIRRLSHLFANDALTDDIAEFKLLAPVACLLVNPADEANLAATSATHVTLISDDKTSMTVRLITCDDVARGTAYLHHPLLNLHNAIAQVSDIVQASSDDIARQQQGQSEQLQSILNQKSRALSRLQKRDQQIPIQIVGEGR
ncbi:NADH-quinone oxidoreductase subunit NuoG [Thalassotalea mangrovi]|uniref:NADH-quinone oxidoreductase subunit G n=1 Tax=Thalassotalea mangrovi TaxID=2572245 RepID=A0A4V5NTX3_9GAMM|nr:NADH-quinone oxidoreductase subunit NuoG [Thalassotalea mangrovi]TKB43433.1 NADH-quinone oxidoreductase subunit NuoG [Thalassotalea mangrovi]